MVNLEAMPNPSAEDQKKVTAESLKSVDVFSGQEAGELNLDEGEIDSALSGLGERKLGRTEETQYNVDVSSLRAEQAAADDVIELSSDDLVLLEDEKPNAEGVIELDSSDLIEEPAGIANEDDSEYSLDKLTAMAGQRQEKPEEVVEEPEEIELDMEEVFERDWSKGEWKESDLFTSGEYVEKIQSDLISGGEMRYATLANRESRDKIEDMVVFNAKENFVAVGDGLGSAKESDKTATVFQQEMSKLELGDLKGMSNEDIQNLVASKFNQIRNKLDETDGQITVSFVKVLEDAAGNKKLLTVNIGDSAIHLASKSEGYQEIGESFNFWKLAERYLEADFMADPENYLAAIASVLKKDASPYLEAGSIVNKIKGAPELSGMTDGFEYHKFVDYLLSENGLTDDEKDKVLTIMRDINKRSVGAFNDTEISPSQVMIKDLKKGESYNIEVSTDGKGDNESEEVQAASMLGGNYNDPEYLKSVDLRTKEELKRVKATAANSHLNKYKPDDISIVRFAIQG